MLEEIDQVEGAGRLPRAVPFEYIISLRNQQVYAHLHLAEQACICHSSPRMLFHKQFTYIGLHLI